MNERSKSIEMHTLLVALAAIVIIVAGLRAASTIVVPFLLSLFLAILCGPPLTWMVRRGMPRGLAIVIVLVVIFTLGVVTVTVIGGLVNQFAQQWPTLYRPQAIALAESWNGRLELRAEEHPWLHELQISDLDALGTLWLNPENLLTRLTGVLLALTETLSNVFFIFLTTIFVIGESTFLPAKIRRMSRAPERSIANIEKISREINHYMGLKTWTSFLTGAIVTLALYLLDVNFALLWGILAFLLNFVPNIGSIIAAIPPVLLALLEHGFLTAALVALAYLCVNMIIGNYLEPRWMGKGLGLSTLVVFLSLVFWGWVLGPVGMIISVPLTMALKIGLESQDETRWLAVLMSGSEIESMTLDGKHLLSENERSGLEATPNAPSLPPRNE